jgi:toxin ParE1/3/4
VNQLRLSPEAEEDIRNIYRYGAATWSVAQAEAYFFTIFDILEAAARGEVAVRRSHDLREGYFKVIIGSHIAYFTKSDDGINVIRILHQSQDGKRHL